MEPTPTVLDLPGLIILDGGFGTELERRGYTAESDPLYGSSLLLGGDKDDIISAVHTSFLNNGARCIKTATYQASVDNLMKHLNVNEPDAEQLLRKAVQLAKDACESFRAATSSSHRPIVAGSVGPYGATLLDGSEYNGLYEDQMTKEALKQWHRRRIAILLDAGVDILALETIPGKREGEALVELLREFPGAKAWLSFSCADGEHTCHHDRFDATVAACTQLDVLKQLLAIGVNCTSPDHISSLLRSARCSAPHVPFVVYPNSGELWTKEKKWIPLSDCGFNGEQPLSALVKFSKEWISLGARFVGGCCRVYPENIKQLADNLNLCN